VGGGHTCWVSFNITPNLNGGMDGSYILPHCIGLDLDGQTTIPSQIEGVYKVK